MATSSHKLLGAKKILYLPFGMVHVVVVQKHVSLAKTVCGDMLQLLHTIFLPGGCFDQFPSGVNVICEGSSIGILLSLWVGADGCLVACPKFGRSILGSINADLFELKRSF